MKEFLKFHLHLKPCEEIVFNNEKNISDNFMSMECVFINNSKHTWVNGYKIYFNGVVFSFKTFNAFFKKFTQLKNDWCLELKSY